MASALLLAALALATQQPPDTTELIERLGADSIEVRDKAAADLLALGSKVAPALRKALAGAEDELRARILRVLEALDRPMLVTLKGLETGAEWDWCRAAWSPDGTVIAILRDKAEVALHAADTLEVRQRRAVEGATEVSFSPSGNVLAVQGRDSTFLYNIPDLPWRTFEVTFKDGAWKAKEIEVALSSAASPNGLGSPFGAHTTRTSRCSTCARARRWRRCPRFRWMSRTRARGRRPHRWSSVQTRA